MDIKIRLGYSYPADSGTVVIAWMIGYASILASQCLLGSLGPCSGVEISGNSLNITLPPPPPYCPSFLHMCLCESIAANGNVTVASCIREKNRRLSYLSTINIVISPMVMTRKLFTVTGRDRRRFVYTVYLLCICFLPVAMMPMFWHDCYHRMVVGVGFVMLFVVSCAMMRAFQIDRDRWEARHA